VPEAVDVRVDEDEDGDEDEDEDEDEPDVVDEVDEHDEPLRTENWVESRRGVSDVFQGSVGCAHDRVDACTVCHMTCLGMV